MKKGILTILLVLGLLGYAQAVTTVGYWKFEEGSGTSVSEQTGNWNNPGTATADLFVAGGAGNNPVYGGSYSIQGDGANYINTNTNISTDLPAGLQWPDWGADFTSEFSIYWDPGTAVDTPIYGSLVTDNNELLCYLQGGNLFQKVLGNDGEKSTQYLQFNFPAALAAGDAQVGWNDVAFVLVGGDAEGDGEDEDSKIYLNGVDVTAEAYVWLWNQQNNIITSPRLAAVPMSSTFQIGGTNVHGPGSARLDELRISQGEVASGDLLMNGEGPTPTQNRGDVTEDLFVGADDLVQILSNWGASGAGATWNMGDIAPYGDGTNPGDDFVGADDYVEVLTFWGVSYPPEPIPEPAVFSLLLLGGLALLRRR